MGNLSPRPTLLDTTNLTLKRSNLHATNVPKALSERTNLKTTSGLTESLKKLGAQNVVVDS